MKLPAINMDKVSGCPYPETTLFGAIKHSAERVPDAPALEFLGKYISFSEFVKRIEQAARALLAAGIKSDDVITICMPNTPQALVCMYAANRIGAAANMVHPLSSRKNITDYVDLTDSKMVLCLDQFYDKVKRAVNATSGKPPIIVARIQEELPVVKGIAYTLFKGRENLKYPDREGDMVWHKFVKGGSDLKLPDVKYIPGKTAVLLYSGGTSGKPKAIKLTDMNFNALGVQMAEICGCTLDYGCKFLSVMPIFHGFGLGVGIHTVLQAGALCILIPQFTKDTYAKAVIKYKPNFIAGVPTLFEALLKVDSLKDADLSFLIGIFSGGDTLHPELKARVDDFLKAHNASVKIREGYGLTESVAASCVTPYDRAKTGSVGLPLRDMGCRIVKPGTFEDLPAGKKGEILLSGPTIMAGYLNEPEETAKALRKDEDGRTWLFTGDMGSMDEDGYLTYTQRLKRMIVTSGYNVYPTHVEDVLDQNPAVDYSCVIGVKDPYKMQRVRAYIVLKNGEQKDDTTKQKILDFCKDRLDVFERPKEIIFKDELPRTLVGKVAYHTLETEAEKEVS